MSSNGFHSTSAPSTTGGCSGRSSSSTCAGGRTLACILEQTNAGRVDVTSLTPVCHLHVHRVYTLKANCAGVKARAAWHSQTQTHLKGVDGQHASSSPKLMAL